MTSVGAARFTSAATALGEVEQVGGSGAPGVLAMLGSNFHPVAVVSLQSASSNVFTQSATYFVSAGRAGVEDRSAGSRNPEAWVVRRVVVPFQRASQTSLHGGNTFPPLVGRFLSAIDSLSLEKTKALIEFLINTSFFKIFVKHAGREMGHNHKS